MLNAIQTGLLCILLVTVSISALSAADSDADNIEALKQRIAQLEAENEKLQKQLQTVTSVSAQLNKKLSQNEQQLKRIKEHRNVDNKNLELGENSYALLRLNIDGNAFSIEIPKEFLTDAAVKQIEKEGKSFVAQSKAIAEQCIKEAEPVIESVKKAVGEIKQLATAKEKLQLIVKTQKQADDAYKKLSTAALRSGDRALTTLLNETNKMRHALKKEYQKAKMMIMRERQLDAFDRKQTDDKKDDVDF